MTTRREFVVCGAAALGTWLVGRDVARRIIRLAAEVGEPYLVTVEAPKVELWAEMVTDKYILSLDQPFSHFDEPSFTWREWFLKNRIDFTNEKVVRDYLEECGDYNPDDEEFVLPELDSPISEGLLQNYIEWEYCLRESSSAQAFHYLIGLDLADRPGSGGALGSIHFQEGTCPGNNTCLVTASSVEALGGLHQRLLQLGERVRVRVC